MDCPDCDSNLHKDSTATISCISCGFRLEPKPTYSNKGLLQGEMPVIGARKDDQGKLRYSLVPPVAIKALAQVLTFGAEKYAPNGWMNVPNAKERYLDALLRHIEAHRSGELLDEESNLSHLSHAITNLAFLLHFEDRRNSVSV